MEFSCTNGRTQKVMQFTTSNQTCANIRINRTRSVSWQNLRLLKTMVIILQLGLRYFCMLFALISFYNKIVVSRFKIHYYNALHCIALHCPALHCIALHCIALYCTVSYCIVLYCIVFYCIVLYCIVLYCIVLYCIVLYCIVLYCTVLYCIVLYCIAV